MLSTLTTYGPLGALVVIVWLHGQERRQDRELRAKEAEAATRAQTELAASLAHLSGSLQNLRDALPNACRASQHPPAPGRPPLEVAR